MKLKRFIQQETVLSVAAVLAVVSAFAVPPDAGYLAYLDLRTLATLFALMTVMAGLRRQGVFDRLGRALLARTQGLLPLVGLLVGLCFFGSMFITNDVALLTFVPFTFSVLRGLGAQTAARLTLPIVCMQTVAANLGSMLTPMGNPQNLYLYGLSGLGLPGFLALMLPYTAVSLLLLAVWTVALCRRTGPAPAAGENAPAAGENAPAAGENAPAAPAAPALPAANARLLWMYAALFVLCLLAVARVLPYPAAFAAVLAAVLLADRPALRLVDYSLLLTFAAFFVFIGNLGRVPAFSAWLQALLAGREVPVAVLASQVISNVPAALLLSGFTGNVQPLIVGTNLGGLGTLIASMASLISYRQIARETPQRKGEYFLLFTVANVVFLALLLAFWAVWA